MTKIVFFGLVLAMIIIPVTSQETSISNKTMELENEIKELNQKYSTLDIENKELHQQLEGLERQMKELQVHGIKFGIDEKK